MPSRLVNDTGRAGTGTSRPLPPAAGRRCWLVVLLVAVSTACVAAAPAAVSDQTARFDEPVVLPTPITEPGGPGLEQVLANRRSVRDYRREPLPLDVLGQLFWAGQGITDAQGHRTAPSAGARYPLELYAITAADLWHYLPDGHRAERRQSAGLPGDLPAITFGQEFVATAPAVLVLTGVASRTEAEYGAVAERLVDREAGHAAQNILLQATALGLGAVPVGGFEPAEVAESLLLPPGEEVLYLIPVGYEVP